MVLYTSRRERAETGEKKFWKGLDKTEKMWYNKEVASRGDGTEKYHSGTLKIEQCNQRETLEDSVFTEETK